jgi:hypothetical protein
MHHAGKLLIITCAALLGTSVQAQSQATPPLKIESGKRDPFWPVGWYPNARKISPLKQGLTGAELRALALAEQDRLKRMLAINGVMSKGGKNIAIISGNMVTEGDVLEIDVSGNTYKLLIKSLTPDNIQLEPVRD